MRVVVAGTFGPIHDGHRSLFRHALQFGTDGVVVGLTGDELAVTTRSEPRAIPAYETRARAVAEECERLDAWGRDVSVVEITDRHDLAVTDPDVDAIVCSPETVGELEAINERRRRRDLEPLMGIVAPFVLAEDGERISSTRLVRGEVDEHGQMASSSDS